jgi:two-component system LytT family response regulator
VEDEPLARQALRRFIAREPALQLVGEAASGTEAIALIEELKPAVLFLDVEMPECSGLQVLEQISCTPLVVFTTAYEQYALGAIAHEAVDYLLKPFTERRFRTAIDRVLRRLAERHAGDDATRGASKAWVERIFVQRRGVAVPLLLRDVLYFESSDDYVTVHTANGSSLAKLTLATLEQTLDPARFQRVHRRVIVNFDHVEQMRPLDRRRMLLRLTGGRELVASRARSRALRALIV